MDRDPSVYIVLSLNTHLEVVYSTVHLFDRQGEIAATRVRSDAAYPIPYDELSEAVEWGSEALNSYYAGDELTFSD